MNMPKVKNLAKIRFYFPPLSLDTSPEDVANIFLKKMTEDGGINYAGYLKDADLIKDLTFRIGTFTPGKTFYLNKKSQKKLTEDINKSLEICNKTLPSTSIPINIFIFPWFVEQKESNLLGGINAVAPFIGTLHLFIDIDRFTSTTLLETLAHEWNHLIYYELHNAKSLNLLDRLVMEGLAECFREEIIGGKPAPWSIALTKQETHKKLKEIKPYLSSKKIDLYKEIFYGNNQHKKWTGYSVGYWLIKEYRKRNPTLSWYELMNKKSKDFL